MKLCVNIWVCNAEILMRFIVWNSLQSCGTVRDERSSNTEGFNNESVLHQMFKQDPIFEIK